MKSTRVDVLLSWEEEHIEELEKEVEKLREENKKLKCKDRDNYRKILRNGP